MFGSTPARRHRREVELHRFGGPLVVAEDERDIERAPVRQPDDIDGEPHVDTLLFADQVVLLSAVRQDDSLVPISQCAGEDVDLRGDN